MIERLISIRNQQINIQISGQENLPVIVFLHGFTGSTATWDEVMAQLKGRFHMIAVDLMGHGKTSIPAEVSRYRMDEQLADLEALFSQLKITNFTLVGYSMGGRIALAYTNKYPERVRTLILESASPGLKTVAERDARKEADAKLANRIETEGVAKFVDFWENIPLFESQKKLSEKQRQRVREERLSQDEIGLSNSLKGMGTGSQLSYWEELRDMELLVLLLTGEIDKKFVDISREMKELLPNATHDTIKNAGHAIHVENPVLFATMVEEHVNTLKNLGRH